MFWITSKCFRSQNLSFSFAQASEGSSGTSKLSVYVYAGEDDNVINPDFNLYLDSPLNAVCISCS